MGGYKVEIEGADRIRKYLERFPEIYQQEIKPFYEQVAFTAEKEAKAKAPVFMGQLRASITHEIKISPQSTYVKVGVAMGNSIYPIVMEFGRRPGAKPPPPSALVRWVHLVINPGADKEYAVARSIALAIGRKGIKGRRYMEAGLNAVVPKLSDWLTDFLDRVIRRIGNA